ncbi:MAG: 16S rRNA (uracil(1498)-N(3))-methyltransferase, partial [Chlorobiaceae bacterium]|nr:16S rRNA (uracil(1498)-N(3))-methyltransferase [Chlorobiaceae bacterium]
GKTILRAETAAVFAVAMVRARLLDEECEELM